MGRGDGDDNASELSGISRRGVESLLGSALTKPPHIPQPINTDQQIAHDSEMLNVRIEELLFDAGSTFRDQEGSVNALIDLLTYAVKQGSISDEEANAHLQQAFKNQGMSLGSLGYRRQNLSMEDLKAYQYAPPPAAKGLQLTEEELPAANRALNKALLSVRDENGHALEIDALSAEIIEDDIDKVVSEKAFAAIAGRDHQHLNDEAVISNAQARMQEEALDFITSDSDAAKMVKSQMVELDFLFDSDDKDHSQTLVSMRVAETLDELVPDSNWRDALDRDQWERLLRSTVDTDISPQNAYSNFVFRLIAQQTRGTIQADDLRKRLQAQAFALSKNPYLAKDKTPYVALIKKIKANPNKSTTSLWKRLNRGGKAKS